MAWKRREVATPVQGCFHKMIWTDRQCWCEVCGQTWGWTPQHKDEAGKLQGGGWFVQPLHAVKYGEYVEEEF